MWERNGVAKKTAGHSGTLLSASRPGPANKKWPIARAMRQLRMQSHKAKGTRHKAPRGPDHRVCSVPSGERSTLMLYSRLCGRPQAPPTAVMYLGIYDAEVAGAGPACPGPLSLKVTFCDMMQHDATMHSGASIRTFCLLPQFCMLPRPSARQHTWLRQHASKDPALSLGFSFPNRHPARPCKCRLLPRRAVLVRQHAFVRQNVH